MKITLKEAYQNAALTPLTVQNHEGEPGRALVSRHKQLVADCFAPTYERLDLPGNYRLNAALLAHAYNVLPELVEALEVARSWMDGLRVQLRNGGEADLEKVRAALTKANQVEVP